MATLTSTGAVNLTSSTNWSPEQTPTTGDDLIIGAHTLTLDADMTLNSVTFNNASSRLAISGTTRSVQATNGWILATNLSAQLITTAIPSGTSLTLTGAWSGNFNLPAMASSTGGNLTLQTVGADQTAALFTAVTGAFSRVITQSWTAGTLTTIGRFDLTTAWTHGSALVIMSGGIWSHQSSGLNSTGNGIHRFAGLAGSATLNWTGSVESNSTLSSGSIALFDFASTSTSNTLGQSGDTFIHHFAGSSSSISPLVRCTAGAVELNGNFSSTNDSITIYMTTGGTVNYRNQAVTVQNDEVLTILLMGGGTCNISGLVVTNHGKCAVAEYGTASIVTDSGTSITCTSTSATACAVGTTSLDGKIITLESDPPTLPAVEDVASGTIYGYTGIELTGTGLILDPSVLATAVDSAITNNDEVLETLANAKIAAMKLGG